MAIARQAPAAKIAAFWKARRTNTMQVSIRRENLIMAHGDLGETILGDPLQVRLYFAALFMFLEIVMIPKAFQGGTGESKAPLAPV